MKNIKTSSVESIHCEYVRLTSWQSFKKYKGSVTLCDGNRHIKPCVSNPCKNGGTCTFNALVEHGYTCDCPASYSGVNCESNPCSGSPCMNEGTCVADEDGGYSCVCVSGYFGDECETDACQSSPCKNGGVCQLSRSSTFFTCYCANGYEGLTCETNSCPLTCRNDGKCQRNNKGEFVCRCDFEFTGSECQYAACKESNCGSFRRTKASAQCSAKYKCGDNSRCSNDKWCRCLHDDTKEPCTIK